MGKYYYIVNDTIKQRLDPKPCGEVGVKLQEFVPGNGRVWSALAVLLNADWTPEGTEQVAGTWSGHAIRLVGTGDPDYKEVSDNYEDVTPKLATMFGHSTQHGNASYVCAYCGKVSGMLHTDQMTCMSCGAIQNYALPHPHGEIVAVGSPNQCRDKSGYSHSVNWSDDSKCWTSSCGLVSFGATEQEAKNGLKDVVARMLDNLSEFGTPHLPFSCDPADESCGDVSYDTKWSDENKCWISSCGLAGSAYTKQEAHDALKKVAAQVLEDFSQYGEPSPQLRSSDNAVVTITDNSESTVSFERGEERISWGKNDLNQSDVLDRVLNNPLRTRLDIVLNGELNIRIFHDANGRAHIIVKGQETDKMLDVYEALHSFVNAIDPIEDPDRRKERDMHLLKMVEEMWFAKE